MHFASAFGLVWQSDFELEHFFALSAEAPVADVTVRRVAALAERVIVGTINRGAVCRDGFRFTWEDQAAIDVYGIDRVEVAPLSGWRGSLPLAFYSTVAALVLALRGDVPFHASGIVVDGKAVLICGESGAGKSTLSAGLVQQGAGFMADDLCAVRLIGDRAQMLPGRPRVRLFAEVAALIGAQDVTPVPDDLRGKVTVGFGNPPLCEAPLGLIVMVGNSPLPEPLVMRFVALRRHLFRPRWLSRLPLHAERQKAVRALVTQVPMIALPPLGRVDPENFADKCRATLTELARSVR